MKRKYRTFCASLAIAALLGIATPAVADETDSLDLALVDVSSYTTTFEFSEERLGGFERKKLTRDLKVRGWEVAENVYFGQAKVGKKWGLGFVYEDGDTVYGLNHRGLQVMKRF